MYGSENSRVRLHSHMGSPGLAFMIGSLVQVYWIKINSLCLFRGKRGHYKRRKLDGSVKLRSKSVYYANKALLISLTVFLCLSMSTDRYQVLGRNVHMDFVKEHLASKKGVNFQDSQDHPNNIELEVLADTIYVKVRYLLAPQRTFLSGHNSKSALWRLD